MKLHRNALRAARNRGKRAGFSLAELMVVIVILGLLATLVVPAVLDRLIVANVGVAKSDLTQIAAAITNYAADNGGRHPQTLEELIVRNDLGVRYLDRDTLPMDPWGNEYLYEPPGPGQPDFVVTTLGKDGAIGGEGEDRDLTNIMVKNQEI